MQLYQEIITSLGIGSVMILSRSYAFAQIIPDQTLPINSQVTVNGTTLEIIGGTPAGSNLFHSFREFSAPENSTAYFNNAATIQNIFTRVTGSSISNINGILKANHTANLFLINPNGFIFGPKAKLDIGGSFLVTTANRLQFADGQEFIAQSSQTQPLLTVSVPIGLQLENNQTGIQIQGSNLSVKNDQSLAFVGNNITINQGNLTAPKGRIELTAVETGNVSMAANSGKISLQNLDGLTKLGEIQLSNQASVDATGEAGGDIQIQGSRLSLTGGSRIVSFSLSTQPGGNLEINTTESVELMGSGQALLASLLLKAEIGTLKPTNFTDGLFVGTFGTGTGGNLSISTPILRVQNGSVLGSFTAGLGRGGDLNINAKDLIEIVGVDDLSVPFEPSSNVQITLPTILNGLGTLTFGGAASGGNITLNTRQLKIRDRSGILAGTFGSGQGGNLTINASEKIETTNGGILATGTFRTGNAGDVKLTTQQLNLRDRGGIFSGTLSQGNAGNILINAQKIFMHSASVAASTSIISNGNGGDITVNAADVELAELGFFASQTEGSGRAGSIIINTERLIANGKRAGATTASKSNGQSGDLIVNASELIELIGISPGPFIPTEETALSIFQPSNDFGNFTGLATANLAGNGDAGNLTINTPRLVVQNGAGVTTSTLAGGKGGNLTIRASDQVELNGRVGLVTTTLGNQNAGNLILETPQLNLRNGAIISADTIGVGNAGNLTISTAQFNISGGSRVGVATGKNSTGQGGNLSITASEILDVAGTSANGEVKSGLFANTDGFGSAGNVNIEAEQVKVRNGAEITVRGAQKSQGAGNLIIQANSLLLENGTLSAETAAGDRGNIILNSSTLQLRNNSRITTNATGTATGGNINLNTQTLAALENSDITANSIGSFGGQVNIVAQGIFLQGNSENPLPRETSPEVSDITATSQLGPQFDGNVNTQTPEFDPTQGLLAPPIIFDQSGLIVQRCPAEKGNKFMILGRGGLPPTPLEFLRSEEPIMEENVAVKSQTENVKSSNLVEATAWKVENGQVILTASHPTSFQPAIANHCHIPNF